MATKTNPFNSAETLSPSLSEAQDYLLAQNAFENTEFSDENEVVEDLETDALFNAESTSALPIININKITLEPTGGDIIPENNPHVDDTGKAPNIFVDEYGQVQFASKTVDYLTKTTTPSGLLVRIGLTVKEVQRRSNASDTYSASWSGTWFDNEGFLKYLNIRVVESTSKELTAEFTTKEYEIDPQSYADSKYKDYASEKIISVKNEIASDIEEYNSYLDYNGNRIYNVDFEVSFFHNQTDLQHLSYFVHAYIDVEQISADHGCEAGNLSAAGLSVRQGYTTAESVIRASRASQTSYAYLTPDDKYWTGPIYYREELGFVTDQSPKAISLRRQIVENGKIEDLRDTISAERAEIEFSVMESALTNLKLTSLQPTLADVIKEREYFSQLYNSRDSAGRFRGMVAFNYQKFLRDQTEFGSLFANPNLSAVELMSNACRISLLKVIRERVENLETLNAVNSKIYGRQPFGVRESAIVTNTEAPATIVYSSAPKGGSLRPYTRKITMLGQAVESTEKNTATLSGLVTAGTLNEIEVYPATDKTIRHFAFSDYQIQRATDGYYRYGIEIILEDGTKEYLADLSKNLLAIKKQLETYYNQATSRTNGKKNYNTNNKKYTQAFVNLLNLQYPIPQRNRISAVTSTTYDPYTADLNPAFLKAHQHSFVLDENGNGRTTEVDGHYHRVTNFKIGPAIEAKKRKPTPGGHHHASYVIAPRSNSPWTLPIATYIEMLDIFSAGKHNIDVQKLSGMLSRMISPETGAPENILRFIKLIDDLYHKIHKVVSTPKSVKDPSSTTSSKKSKKMIKFIKMFDEVLDSNVQKNVGYDYLGEAQMNLQESGLFLMNGRTYINRASRETSKYFCADTGDSINVSQGDTTYVAGDLIADNQLSFLSPAAVDLGGGQRYNLLTGCNLEEQIWSTYELETRVSEFNLNTSTSPAISAIADNKEDSLLAIADLNKQFLGNLNVTVEDITEYSQIGVHVAKTQDPVRGVKGARDYMGQDSRMVGADLSKQDLVGGTVGNIPRSIEVAIAEATNGTLSHLIMPIKNGIYSSDANTNMLETNATSDGYSGSGYDINSPYNVLQGITADEFVQFPNQIKSIFVRNSPANKLIDLISASDITTQAAIESTLKISLQLLREVEVLSGYEIGKTGDILVKKEVWTNLTYDLYNDTVGQTLLCRLRGYHNTNIGGGTPTLLELPVYNQYFLMVPAGNEKRKTNNRTRNNPRGYQNSRNAKKQEIKDTIKQNLSKNTVPAYAVASSILVGETLPKPDTGRRRNQTTQGNTTRRTRRGRRRGGY